MDDFEGFKVFGYVLSCFLCFWGGVRGAFKGLAV